MKDIKDMFIILVILLLVIAKILLLVYMGIYLKTFYEVKVEKLCEEPVKINRVLYRVVGSPKLSRNSPFISDIEIKEKFKDTSESEKVKIYRKTNYPIYADSSEEYFLANILATNDEEVLELNVENFEKLKDFKYFEDVLKKVMVQNPFCKVIMIENYLDYGEGENLDYSLRRLYENFDKLYFAYWNDKGTEEMIKERTLEELDSLKRRIRYIYYEVIFNSITDKYENYCLHNIDGGHAMTLNESRVSYFDSKLDWTITELEELKGVDIGYFLKNKEESRVYEYEFNEYEEEYKNAYKDGCNNIEDNGEKADLAIYMAIANVEALSGKGYSSLGVSQAYKVVNSDKDIRVMSGTLNDEVYYWNIVKEEDYWYFVDVSKGIERMGLKELEEKGYKMDNDFEIDSLISSYKFLE